MRTPQMHELTQDQQEKLDRRRAGLDQYLEERMPVLVEFCDRLELPEPHRVLIEAELFLAPIDDWVAQQELDGDVNQEDRVWLASRLAYFLGELLAQRFHGCWFVDDNPNGRYFGNYVVGQFSHFPNGRVDPSVAIWDLLSQPVGRSLVQLVEEMSSELVELAPKDST